VSTYVVRPLFLYPLAALWVLGFLSACSTAPVSVSPKPVTPSAHTLPVGPTLAEQIQTAISAIDQILLRYEILLTTIERLPDDRHPEKIFTEVSTFFSGDVFEANPPPTQQDLTSLISTLFSFSSQVVIIETGVQADLLAVSERLVDLHAKTLSLAGRFEQGGTVHTYTQKVRRELMPLLAQLRGMSRADLRDRDSIARLEAETRKLVATSRQSIQALERETRSLEQELGKKP